MKEKSLMRSSVCVNYMMCIDNKKFLFFLYIYICMILTNSLRNNV